MSEEAVTPVVEEPAAPPEPLTPEQEDAAIDAIVAEKGIDIPNDAGGEKLVPLSALTTVRGKLKDARAELSTAKEGSAREAQLLAQIETMQAQLAEAGPLASAYKTFIAAQAQPPKDQGPSAEELAELEAIARDEDYYKTDSSLDLDRAKRHRDRIVREAERIAQRHVAPMQQQTVNAASEAMYQNALVTVSKEGLSPPPEYLKAVWERIGPEGTATKQGAVAAYMLALGAAVSDGKAIRASAAQPRQELPVPLVIEKAGGKDTPAPQATAADERAARDLGIPVAEYMKTASAMPKGWGKS